MMCIHTPYIACLHDEEQVRLYLIEQKSKFRVWAYSYTIPHFPYRRVTRIIKL